MTVGVPSPPSRRRLSWLAESAGIGGTGLDCARRAFGRARGLGSGRTRRASHRSHRSPKSGVPTSARDEALRRVLRLDAPTAIGRNRLLHRYLVDGVEVEYAAGDGRIAGSGSRLIDFDRPGRQRLAGGQPVHDRRGPAQPPARHRPLRQRPAAGGDRAQEPADESATIWSAFNQLQTYKAQIPTLFASNALLVISDGVEAPRRLADRRTASGSSPGGRSTARTLAPDDAPELEVAASAGCSTATACSTYLRHFVVFEDDGGGVVKKIAGYHQFHAVNRAVDGHASTAIGPAAIAASAWSGTPRARARA